MVAAISNAYKKFAFCIKHSATVADAFALMVQTKKYGSLYNSASAKNLPTQPIKYRLQFSGKKLQLYARTANGDLGMFYEIFQQETYSIPAALLTPASVQTIVDAGANVGFTSLYLHIKYPKAKIFSIEASKENARMLQLNAKNSSAINPINAAVFTDERMLSFAEAPLAYNSKIDTQSTTGYQVPGLHIGQWMQRQGIDKIDLLKMDIEGAEAEVLHTNNEWLSKIGCLIIELHQPYNLEKFQRDLSPFGFTIWEPPYQHLKMIVALKQ